MATIDYVGDSGPDGVVVAKDTTTLLAFHGSTPIAQASIASLATAATIATTTATVQAILTALVNKGLIALS